MPYIEVFKNFLERNLLCYQCKILKQETEASQVYSNKILIPHHLLTKVEEPGKNKQLLCQSERSRTLCLVMMWAFPTQNHGCV